MSGYYILEPEVAGGLGPRTIMDRSVHPPRVTHLHYHFEGWLGDQLVESFPCWLVTAAVGAEIKDAGLTGAEFGDAEVSASETFRELHPGRSLPSFRRLL